MEGLSKALSTCPACCYVCGKSKRLELMCSNRECNRHMICESCKSKTRTKCCGNGGPWLKELGTDVQAAYVLTRDIFKLLSLDCYDDSLPSPEPVLIAKTSKRNTPTVRQETILTNGDASEPEDLQPAPRTSRSSVRKPPAPSVTISPPIANGNISDRDEMELKTPKRGTKRRSSRPGSRRKKAKKSSIPNPPAGCLGLLKLLEKTKLWDDVIDYCHPGKREQSRRSLVVTPPLRTNKKGETPLHIAVNRNRLDEVNQLLNDGADPNQTDFNKWTPLHDAMSVKVDESIVEALLSKGARPDAHGGSDAQTPLHMAVEYEDMDKVTLLMNFGANPDAPDLHDKTPRKMATPAMLKLLNNIPPKPAPPPTPTLRPTSVHLYKLPQTEALIVKNFIKMYGIKEKSSFFDATHIVCSQNFDFSKFDAKLVKVMAKGQPIVSSEWAQECMRQNSWIDVADYIREPAFLPGYSKAVTNAQLLRPGLFSGIHVFINEKKTGSRRRSYRPKDAQGDLSDLKSIDIADLKEIIRRADGTVLTREPDPESPNRPHLTPYHGEKKCQQYIVNTEEVKLQYRMDHLKSVDMDWLIKCVLRFEIFPFPIPSL